MRLQWSEDRRASGQGSLRSDDYDGKIARGARAVDQTSKEKHNSVRQLRSAAVEDSLPCFSVSTRIGTNLEYTL
jgi:hypothetical protein